MSGRFQDSDSDFRTPRIVEPSQTLPGWLADRLLQPNEKVEWVRGPRFTPSWERYITHPGLFFAAAALAACCVGAAVSYAKGQNEVILPVIALSGAIVIVAILVLAYSSGYFTRLVATDTRLLIVQGYELCRNWDINDLPLSLIRYRPGGGNEMPSIDLNAVQSLLGGSSTQFTGAKEIMSFAKQLDRIKKERG
jgi:hypothetical protein